MYQAYADIRRAWSDRSLLMSWAAAAGAALGIGAGVGGAIMSAKQAKKNRQWQRKNYKHRYQWTMKDMRKAGLNPILAAGSGLGGGGSAGPGATGQVPDLAQSMSSAADVGTKAKVGTSQKALLQEQVTTAKTQQTLNAASESKAQADARLADKHNIIQDAKLPEAIAGREAAALAERALTTGKEAWRSHQEKKDAVKQRKIEEQRRRRKPGATPGASGSYGPKKTPKKRTQRGASGGY